MALVLKDRVKVTTTTTGTGALTLGGAQFGYQDFSGFSNGDTTYYTIVDSATGAWEVGLGTYSSAGPTLTRTTVLASSTGGTVNFGAGPKDVFVSYPAGRAVTSDGAVFTGPITVPAGATGAQVPQAQEVGDLAIAQRGDIYRRANIVGSVSQSGGVPTGAAIEYGTNVNGAYLRFADGTQICWANGVGSIWTTGTGTGNVFRTNPDPAAVTFPATFAVAPLVLPTPEVVSNNVWAIVTSVSTTSVSFRGLGSTSGSQGRSSYVAIGRWFL